MSLWVQESGIKLTHWVDKDKVDIVLSGNGVPREKAGFLKPSGFWLSVNGDWESYCKSGFEDWMINKVCLNVELDDNTELFKIETKKQFCDKFKDITGKEYPSFLSVLKPIEMHDIIMNRYKWVELFNDAIKDYYDGMWTTGEVIYGCRLDADCDYFYGWDCESMCVWNKNKIRFYK